MRKNGLNFLKKFAADNSENNITNVSTFKAAWLTAE